MDQRLDYIFRRRSIRKYQETSVESDKLDMLLQAGMAAPSAMNAKPWEFIVVTDPAKLESLRKVTPYSNYCVPSAIVVCGNLGFTENPIRRLFWVQDCSAATENILLAACALDLATVWIGLHPIQPYKSAVKKVLRLPSQVIPLSLIYVGYPAVEKESRSQYDPSRVHWQQFGSEAPSMDKA